MVKTLLLSALTRQFLIQGRRFSELHPNDWLLWEAGSYHVPRGNIATATTVTETLDSTGERPRVGDPLCFVLPSGTDGTTVTIGRAEGNDLVLSDAAVSRHHATLVHGAHGWSVSSSDEHAKLTLDGAVVQFGQWLPVASGQKLVLGHLELSLFTSRGMLRRLAQKLAKKP